MATVKIVLEVEKDGAVTGIKQFETALGTAFEKVRAAGTSSFTGVQASSQKLDEMMRRSAENIRPVEDAYRTLGLRAPQAIEQARARMTTAFDTIKQSGVGSATELQRAQRAYEQQLRKLSEEATPRAVKSNEELVTGLRNVDRWLSQAGVSTGVFGRVIGALTSPIGLAIAAVTALAAAAKVGVDAVVKNAQEVRALMAVSGLGAEAADNLANAFQLLDIDASVLTMALSKMGQEIDSGAVGLTKLGITVRKETGELKTEGEVFLEIRDRISEIGSASQRNAVLVDLFGRSGRALAAAFALSREEFEKLLQKAKGISPWDDEAQENTLAYTRAINELSGRFTALQQTVGLGVVPTLTKYLGLLNQLLEKKDITTTIRVLWQFLGADPKKTTAQNLAEMGLGPDLARGLGITSGFRGAGASGSWDDASVAPPPTDIQIRRWQQQAQQRLNIVTQGLDRETAARQAAVALGTATEGNALAAELAALDRRQTATATYYAELRRLAALRTDNEGNAVREVQTAEDQAMNQLLVQRTDVQKRLQVMGREYAASAADEAIKRNIVERDEAAKTAAFTRDVTAQLLTSHTNAYGTEMEKFVRAEQDKLDAFERRQYDQADLDGQYLEAYQRVQAARAIASKNVENEIAKRDGERATAQASSLREWTVQTETATERVEREYRDAFHTWDQLRANGLIEEDEFQRRVQRLREVTNDKWTQALIEELELEERRKQRALESTAAQARATGEYLTFFGAQLKLTALQSGNLWTDIENGARSLFSGLTDLTADWISQWRQGTFDIGQAWKDLSTLIIQEAERLIAQQAVRALFKFAGDAISGTSGSAAEQLAGPAAEKSSSSWLDTIVDTVVSWFGAKGGVVPGGPPYTDRVPAMLTPGERVLTRDQNAAMEQAGVQFMARGGIVSGQDYSAGSWLRMLPLLGRFFDRTSNLGGAGSREPLTTQALREIGLTQQAPWFSSVGGFISNLVESVVEHALGFLPGGGGVPLLNPYAWLNTRVAPYLLDVWRARELNAETRKADDFARGLTSPGDRPFSSDYFGTPFAGSDYEFSEFSDPWGGNDWPVTPSAAAGMSRTSASRLVESGGGPGMTFLPSNFGGTGRWVPSSSLPGSAPRVVSGGGGGSGIWREPGAAVGGGPATFVTSGDWGTSYQGDWGDPGETSPLSWGTSYQGDWGGGSDSSPSSWGTSYQGDWGGGSGSGLWSDGGGGYSSSASDYGSGDYDFFAKGGEIPGGPPYIDRVLAMLTPGERVLTRAQNKALEAAGVQFLAEGGPVMPWRSQGWNSGIDANGDQFFFGNLRGPGPNNEYAIPASTMDAFTSGNLPPATPATQPAANPFPDFSGVPFPGWSEGRIPTYEEFLAPWGGKSWMVPGIQDPAETYRQMVDYFTKYPELLTAELARQGVPAPLEPNGPFGTPAEGPTPTSEPARSLSAEMREMRDDWGDSRGGRGGDLYVTLKVEEHSLGEVVIRDFNKRANAGQRFFNARALFEQRRG